MVTAAAQPIRMSPIGWLLIGAVLFGIELLRGQGVAFTLVMVLVAFALTVSLELLSRPLWARGEAPICRAILLRATQATPESSIDSSWP